MRSKIPPAIATAVLVANRHRCCICRAPREHVELHHIDGDPSNHDPSNLASLCLNCHSQVGGDQGRGRRYSVEEVREYKRRWEVICAQSEIEADEEDEEPEEVLRTAGLLAPEHHRSYELELEEGDEALITVDAADYLGVFVCTPRDLRRWETDDEDLMHFEGDEDVRSAHLSFVAPRSARYLLVLINEGDQEIDFEAEVTVWPADTE